MTQQELDREVAKVTGELLHEIRQRGFTIADPREVAFDPEPAELMPHTIDWDALEQVERPRPFRRRPRAES